MDRSEDLKLIIVIDSPLHLSLERRKRHRGDEVRLARQIEELLVGVSIDLAGHDNHSGDGGAIACSRDDPEVILGGGICDVEREEVKGVETLEIDRGQITEHLLDRALGLELIKGRGVDGIGAL
jgi:hypothetical protein